MDFCSYSVINPIRAGSYYMITENSVLLGIESSCDDMAAAIVKGGILQSSVISSQDVHESFGGVVPELASRAHQRLIVPVVNMALQKAGITKNDIHAVAVTYGPGLAGSLLVGLSFAKAFAFGLGLPLVGVNHLEGHIYSVFIDQRRPSFPYLCLVVSGGHTQIVLVEKDFRHTLLGKTRDDAAGEAFDKVAKLIGLGYPGGPEIDRLAQKGDPNFHSFPRSKPGGFDFSFSGLKTSVLYYLNKYPDEVRTEYIQEHLEDISASFQQAIIDVLIDALYRAIHETGVQHVAIVGGVSANASLRASAVQLCLERNVELYVPSPDFCTDNAAMIATAGWLKMASGITSSFSITAKPNLALD